MKSAALTLAFMALVLTLNNTRLDSSLSAKAQSEAVRITSAALGTDSTPEYRVIGRTDQFTPDAPQIVCVWRVAAAKPGATLKGIWVAENTGGVAPSDYRIAEKSYPLPPGSSPGSISLSKPNKGWPVGSYRLELYIDDKLMRTVPFVIKRERTAVESEPTTQRGSAARTLTGADSASEGGAKGLVGLWESDEAVVEIREDGTLVLNGETLRYEVIGSAIRLTGSDGSVTVPFEFKGDRLVTMYQGERTVYQRKQRASSGGAAGSGSFRSQELVGKWCYMSNVNASNGGRMSNRCFTLYEDGTYEYYAETSSSGQYGGSASQESDGGTWSATATSIRANSRNHGTVTYTLERRNHPKTGDPMLVIDGDAYVTYHQRPPWR